MGMLIAGYYLFVLRAGLVTYFVRSRVERGYYGGYVIFRFSLLRRVFAACVGGTISICGVSVLVGYSASIDVSIVDGSSVRVFLFCVLLRGFSVYEAAIYVGVRAV